MRFSILFFSSLILILASSNWMAEKAAAQKFSRILQDIKILRDADSETLELSFSQSFQGRPEEEHNKKQLSLHFTGTGSSSPIREFQVSESRLFSSLKVIQNRYSTTLRVGLKPGVSLKGSLSYEHQGKRLIISTKGAQASPLAKKNKTGDLLDQMSKSITGPKDSGRKKKPADKEKEMSEQVGGFQGVDWMPAMLTMIIALGIIIGALYLVLYFYRRISANGPGKLGDGVNIRQLASFHLGPRQRIVVVEIDGEMIACGVTPQQINALGKITPHAQRATTKPKKSPAAPSSSPAEAEKAPSDPVQQFADALKEKVGSLKRIK